MMKNLCFFAVDIISAIEFDKSGDHLATGDRGGRVVLFERTDKKEVGHARFDIFGVLHVFILSFTVLRLCCYSQLFNS